MKEIIAAVLLWFGAGIAGFMIGITSGPTIMDHAVSTHIEVGDCFEMWSSHQNKDNVFKVTKVGKYTAEVLGKDGYQVVMPIWEKSDSRITMADCDMVYDRK